MAGEGGGAGPAAEGGAPGAGGGAKEERGDAATQGGVSPATQQTGEQEAAFQPGVCVLVNAWVCVLECDRITEHTTCCG